MPKKTFQNLPDFKRDRIISVAAAEFAANPYEVASISNIVRQAGIAKGSFYQYFEDKKDLYCFLIELGIAEKQNLMKELPVSDPSSDLFGYIRWLFQSAVNFELQHPLLAQITYRAFVEEVPFPEMREELQRRGTTQFFKQLVSQGILHGDIAPWVDPDLAAFLMEAIYYQFGKYFTDRLGLSKPELTENSLLGDEEAQQLISNLMDLFQAGMQRDPEQRKTYYRKD